MTKNLAPLVCCVALLACTLGCSRSGDGFGSDAGQLLSLVLDVSDASGNPEQFAALFLAGAAPADSLRGEFAARGFSLAAEPEIDGDSARLTVSVVDVESRPLGQVNWLARRSGDAWKLAEVTLP